MSVSVFFSSFFCNEKKSTEKTSKFLFGRTFHLNETVCSLKFRFSLKGVLLNRSYFEWIWTFIVRLRYRNVSIKLWSLINHIKFIPMSLSLMGPTNKSKRTLSHNEHSFSNSFNMFILLNQMLLFNPSIRLNSLITFDCLLSVGYCNAYNQS